jgi:hypothetical protein
MQKSNGLFLISVVCIAVILVTGCTSSGSSSTPVTTPAPTTAAALVTTPQIIATPNSQNSSTVSTTSQSTLSTSVSSTVVSQSENSKTLLNESFSLITGDRKSAKIYSFKELGLEFLKPNDTFIISVDSGKPINILVTDATGRGNYNGVKTIWEKQPPSKTTNTKLYGWSYPGIWTELKADEVFHEDLLLKIERAGSYYLIFDPQNIVERVSELGISQITYNNFNVHVSLNQILNPQSLDILPKSPYFIDDKFAVYSGYRDGYKEYPLEDYGLNYLNAGDTYKISIDSEKPVNVFVLNQNEEIQFDTIKPVWEMQAEKGNKGSEYGYTYSGLSPLVKEDKVTKKDIIFTVKTTGKYFVMIDQRFADPYAKTISFFKGEIKLSKI